MKTVTCIHTTALLLAGSLVLSACKPANSTETAADAAVTEPAAVTTATTTEKALPTSTPAPARTKAVAPPPVCANCGTVQAITPVSVQGQGSGVGAAVGALLGGLAGHQVGGGNGKKIATVAGVVGGAYAGNTIEKNRNAERYYEIDVALENGTLITVSMPDATGIAVGSSVVVEGDNLRLR